LNKAADCTSARLRSVLDGKGVPHGVLPAKKATHEETQNAEDHVRPYADLRIGRKESGDQRHDTYAADGEHQQEASPDFVSVMTEERRSDWPRSHGDRIGENNRDVLPSRAALR
jgi:hypothetical protein